ncbi:hypothetical protein BS47DRAFT_1485992 [Hydnum rufescens UP504]|uniref:Uncharacterized protein n=1 Tax=Hydnum rufescens UP504 TaxID=1448309 RepID=A0A9P6DWN4_9AGAM|nr:hypothetical protein BS47DRAFT_1485992 [Hydnum rufescens UP504]
MDAPVISLPRTFFSDHRTSHITTSKTSCISLTRRDLHVVSSAIMPTPLQARTSSPRDPETDPSDPSMYLAEVYSLIHKIGASSLDEFHTAQIWNIHKLVFDAHPNYCKQTCQICAPPHEGEHMMTLRILAALTEMNAVLTEMNAVLTKMNAELMKMNAELTKTNAEFMKINSRLMKQIQLPTDTFTNSLNTSPTQKPVNTLETMLKTTFPLPLPLAHGGILNVRNP